MGSLTNFLKEVIYVLAKKNVIALSIGGFLITLLVFFASGISGWLIEQLFLNQSYFPSSIGNILLAFLLSSSLASNSLRKSVLKVLDCFNQNSGHKNILNARKELKDIVGRDVEKLSEVEILRGAAESASENSIDGIFAPLFWIFIGAIAWEISSSMPGPLAFAWAFKASSTMDSMIGYREGDLEWLGKTSAKLDDFLTFIPCRLVVITLPLICKNWFLLPLIISTVFKEGSRDLSPNSGLSEAIFAHCTNIRMGGENLYKNVLIKKPILSKSSPEASIKSIRKILELSLKLELVWVLFMILILLLIQAK